MDPGWDHTENEDKHLLAHTLLMSTVNDQHIYVSTGSIGTTDGGGGCGSGSQELVSLSGESTKHLLSVVINNYNLLFGLSPAPFEFPVLIYYYYQLCYLHSCICEICKICNSDCKCECNCECVSKCNSSTICLCLCNCTKAGDSNGCVCICKHKSCKCVCICICLCDKTGKTWCCGSASQHNCKKCLVKVDIKSLLCDTWRILCDLRWIKCYISKIENKCCSCSCCQNVPCNSSCCESCRLSSNTGCCCCSCCVNGPCRRESCESYCCCKTGTNYSSIISKISIVVILFKEVGKKILELTKMNKTLTFYSKKANSCKSCKCKEKVEDLIKNIEKDGQYYSSFASVVGDIKLLVDYKTFSPQSNEIIDKLKMSVKPLLNQLYLVNQQLLGSSTYTGTLDKLLIGVYSHYCIFQCFLGLYILLQSSSISYSIFYILKTPNDCECVKCFDKENKNIEKFSIKTFDEHICSGNDFQKLIVNKEGNHVCLCLVVKLVLYPSLIKSMYLLRYIYLDALSKQTKEFIPGMFTGIDIKYETKLVYLMIIFLDKITLWMKAKYYYAWIGYVKGVYIKCFCMYSDDPYYPYLISITLFVSSLVENIWTMDHDCVVKGIEKLSNLLSEYQSLHVYTNYYTPSTYNMLRRISSVLTKGKSIEGTLSYSAMGVGLNNNKQSLVKSNIITTLTQSKEKAETISTSVISTLSGGLVNESTKLGFMSLRTMILGTHFSKDKFTLIYGKFSSLAFYIQNSNISKVTMETIRNPVIEISVKYLDEICKQPCRQTCCLRNGVCRICPMSKIKIGCLRISLKKTEVVLANVSADILLNYLIGSINISEDFITNLCVGFGEVYAIMLKNHRISYPDSIASYGRSNDMGVKYASTANWGYDTSYEHSITTDNSYSDISPKLTKIIHKIAR